MAGLRCTAVLCGVALVLPVGASSFQSSSDPRATFRYTAAQLVCATFRERSRGQLEAQTGMRQRRETLVRDGVLRVRARSADSGITLEAWYDSLALSRESPEGTIEPDTDGLLGGRYRGTLTPTGRYVTLARPFVPDEVAEVAELGTALDDLLPPLPPVPLAVGQRWTDQDGLTLTRLPDSVSGRRVLLRLALRAVTKSNRATVRGDTTALEGRQSTREEGQVTWDPATGLVLRSRRLVVETSVAAGGPLRQPLRSQLSQEASLVRIGDRACPGASGEP
ncbi:MAG TPA: hypothetical protein VMY76_00895 [Gemmatimonadales bacterium]|nr:hypothetical protein [Gemmatimonadales bacterium]